MKKVYISGPMTGLPESNYPAFMKAERKIKSDEYHCVNPARLGNILIAEHQLYNRPDPEWKDFMAVCLKEIPHCHEIYLLRGWENSKGAFIEFTNAKLFGLKVRFE